MGKTDHLLQPIFIYCFAIFLFAGCRESLNKTSAKKEIVAENVAVKWELISNFTKDGYTARLGLTNRNKEALTDKNWALFFSISPSLILPTDTPQPAKVEHIDGDWYKLIPNKGFHLDPGDSISVDYKATEARIKQTDEPMGIYMVYYDKDGKQESIAKVEDFTLVPFTRREQMLRGTRDKEEPYSSEKEYRENESLSVLSEENLLPIIPSPVSYKKQDGIFTLDLNTIYYQDTLQNEAEILKAKLEEITGRGFGLNTGKAGIKEIRLEIAPSKVKNKSPEGYHLVIDKNGITISGVVNAGVFYGIQSLLSLLPTRAYTENLKYPEIVYATVDDAPRFGFRSLHVDVSRNFQTKETILKTLDIMAHYKLNYMLLYTSEDEGWRVEIPGLPELTQTGGQRQHLKSVLDPALFPAYGSGPFAYDPGFHGSGFYTRNDFIEILKYAKARHITIIPELNFPGHARAAIKAMEERYDRLMKEGKEDEANEYRLIDPNDKSVYLSPQLYNDDVVNVSRESTYHFFEKVVDEFAKMYEEAGLKMKIFHVGGDEVAEGAWAKSPEAIALMKKNPEIKNPKNLQTYFLKTLLQRLKSKNLEIHGWEEVALTKNNQGHYDPNPEFVNEHVVPYIWNNLFDYPDLGYRLANFGYDVVLCNVSNFYFDLAYNNDPQEPGAYWGGFINSKKAWAFAPFNMFNTTFKNSMGEELFWDGPDAKWAQLKPEAKKHIKGLEAQLWAETIKGQDTLEYYMLPKLIGFAESAWAPARSWETESNRAKRIQSIDEGWNVFANTIAQKEFPIIGKINGGYNYRIPPVGAKVEDGKVWANVALPGIKIYYTIDGSEPTILSHLYNAPVVTKGIIKFKTFDVYGRAGRTVMIENN